MIPDMPDSGGHADRHRSRVDIAYDILVSARGGGSKKTHILYKANISSTQAEHYFSALLAHGLLEHASDIEGNDVLRTTDKGSRYIDCCEELRSLMDPVMNSRRMGAVSEYHAVDTRR